MTAVSKNNSIRLKIKKLIYERPLRMRGVPSIIPTEKGLDDNFLDDTSVSNASCEQFEVFNKYRNNDIIGDRYRNIDGNHMCVTNKSTIQEIFGDLLEIDFDTCSELNEEDEGVIMELTPFEEVPSQANSLRRAIKNKLKRLVSHSPTVFHERHEYEGDNYSPLSMRIPVIEDTEYNNRLDILLFEIPVTDDPRIKFNEYVDVLIYNGNYTAKPDIETSPGSGGKLWRNLSLRKNSIRQTITSSQRIRPILRSKTNENYEYEALQVKAYDNINFEKFMDNFENRETSKLNQEPYLNGARINQLKNYYHSNNDCS